eukprot:gene33272-55866_t
MPRFTAENYAANLKLLTAYNALAQDAGCSPSQLALAWLLHKAPHIVPIPGTTSVAHLLDDLGAVNVSLSAQLIEQLDQLINQHTVQGARYSPQGTSETSGAAVVGANSSVALGWANPGGEVRGQMAIRNGIADRLISDKCSSISLTVLSSLLTSPAHERP